MTVKDTHKLNYEKCLGGFITLEDIVKINKREIVYTGPGMYSMNDDKVYIKGQFATYSRICLD